MARPLRIEFEGAVYHVTTRGDRREPIFVDDADRDRLLSIFGQAMHRFDAEAFAYCLMGNHYHVVVRTRRANLSALMRHVNGVYTQRFNRRHDISGHLFQGRFHSVLVDCEAYLLAVCRYVELNPVRAGFVQSPGEWRWSSYRAHVGREATLPWLEAFVLHSRVLGREPSNDQDRLHAAERYAEFVEAGRDERLWATALRQEIYLGDDDFVDRMQERIEISRKNMKEIPASQRRSSLLDAMAHPETRAESLRRAFVEGGMPMSEIARETRLSPSWVSRLIGQAEARERADRSRQKAPYGEADPPLAES
jgi:putative transposase